MNVNVLKLPRLNNRNEMISPLVSDDCHFILLSLVCLFACLFSEELGVTLCTCHVPLGSGPDAGDISSTFFLASCPNLCPSVSQSLPHVPTSSFPLSFFLFFAPFLSCTASRPPCPLRTTNSRSVSLPKPSPRGCVDRSLAPGPAIAPSASLLAMLLMFLKNLIFNRPMNLSFHADILRFNVFQ